MGFRSGLYEVSREAVKLITEGGLSISEAGRRLLVSSSTIGYWVAENLLNRQFKARAPNQIWL
ncbi:MAG: hypothetical protein ACP5SG_09590, partial [Dissulfurimicrobium sp.]